MVKAVFDTNILVSGLLYIGKPRRLIEHVINGKIDLILSPVTHQVSGVISRDKFKLSKSEQELLVSFVIRISTIVKVKSRFNVVHESPDDDKVFEAAYDGKVLYIVSGDHHLLDLKRIFWN